MSLSKAKAHL